MSWQATAWAAKQKTGSAARKVLLLVLANYADEHGICWPSQETLKIETELSEDTIQRHTKALQRMRLLDVDRRRRKSGTWSGKIYRLNLRVVTTPQNAVWSTDKKNDENAQGIGVGTTPQCAADQAAMTTATTPQALRHKPSLEEPSLIEPSVPSRSRAPVAARLLAFQNKQEGIEVIQNRVASRLGPDGWEVLQEVSDDELRTITDQEQRGELAEADLSRIRRRYRRGAA